MIDAATMQRSSYVPIQQVVDVQPVRTACFHPSGEAYVVGSNSKTLRICKYPDADRITNSINDSQRINSTDQSTEPTGSRGNQIPEPEILFSCLHIHSGSVYCATFNQAGNLLATGSNDQLVHIIQYDSTNHAPQGSEYKLAFHTGTVRDVCFLAPGPSLGDNSFYSTPCSTRSPSSRGRQTNLLASAGAGEFEVNVSDCNVMKRVHSFRGHQAAVMSLHSSSDSDSTFVSGSCDGTIRVWDLRCRNSASIITTRDMSMNEHNSNGVANKQETPILVKQESEAKLQPPPASESRQAINGASTGVRRPTSYNRTPARQAGQENRAPPSMMIKSEQAPRGGAPVGCVRLDASGRLLVSGHLDGSCMLYDIRACKGLQLFKAHEGEIRTLNLSPNCYYLLSGGYDGQVRLADMQGQLANKLPCVLAAELGDKCVQAVWHPRDLSFVTTCADGTATLWAIPNFDEWLDRA